MGSILDAEMPEQVIWPDLVGSRAPGRSPEKRKSDTAAKYSILPNDR